MVIESRANRDLQFIISSTYYYYYFFYELFVTNLF